MPHLGRRRRVNDWDPLSNSHDHHTALMRTKSSKTLIALASAAVFWVAAAPAHASPTDVIRDCSQDGKLDKHYTEKELVGALRKLPSDVDEYTDCRGVIRRAELAGA